MVDWQSPAQIMKQAIAFTNLNHALLGLYLWEWFLSLDFDFAFIFGRKKFRWPMIFYFANRYLLLFAMIGIIVSLDVTTEINCQVIYTFNQIAGDAAIGLASINLAIRTIAIWSHNRYVIIGLVLVILGHWSLILQGVQLKASWVDGVGCVITETNNRILAAIFIYSMCFDLLILLINTYKLLGLDNGVTARSLSTNKLSKLIFEDGLIFFFIAFVANLIATVFMLLNLSQIMTVIFNVPAAIFSTIVACRAVRRLTNFSIQGGAEVFSTGVHSSTPGNRGPRIPALSHPNLSGTKTGVHVQMETFTHGEDVYDGNKNRNGSDTDVELDLEKGAKL
ncbi:hypothetical protein FA15DRAFT_703075 [Coprinopsis marcescibilis]|uniref:Transmembrane protein n=1 Tax=Coprinopsis marcescibilis TaxID=230819 RepID=A0A5C3KZK8_COPMA|nr:hypothetical protein FA15DRAFT_703075 [Coprinopsis marcescibilis]